MAKTQKAMWARARHSHCHRKAIMCQAHCSLCSALDFISSERIQKDDQVLVNECAVDKSWQPINRSQLATIWRPVMTETTDNTQTKWLPCLCIKMNKAQLFWDAPTRNKPSMCKSLTIPSNMEKKSSKLSQIEFLHFKMWDEPASSPYLDFLTLVLLLQKFAEEN